MRRHRRRGVATPRALIG
uniref:Uncharacterized protein n=1 Tax=Arundo donax TaxID=35708 RepID=A0A0A9U5N8_ARUDO